MEFEATVLSRVESVSGQEGAKPVTMTITQLLLRRRRRGAAQPVHVDLHVCTKDETVLSADCVPVCT